MHVFINPTEDLKSGKPIIVLNELKTVFGPPQVTKTHIVLNIQTIQ